MRRKAWMITLLVCVAMLMTTPLVVLAKGPGSGGGGGGNAGDAAGVLYGDLYVIERDGAGVPITREVTYTDSETGQSVTVNCPQPLADNCSLLPLWGECGTTLQGCTFDPELYDPCAVYGTDTDPTFTDQLQTVSFGRMSVSRAPAMVMDKSYAEALKAINLAVPQQCDTPEAIKQDPAGRIMLCLATETEPVTHAWKTIDSPLENLGMYREVMTDGCFSPIDEVVVGEGGLTITVTTFLSDAARGYLNAVNLGHLVCVNDTILPEPKEKADMLSAAVFIAAGADKFYPITLDEIINVNTYIGVNPYTYVKQRKDRILTVEYYPFKVGEEWFTYDLGVDACVPGTLATLLSGASPAYTVSTFDVFGGSPPGVDLRGGNGVAITVCRGGSPLGVVCDDPATNPAEASGIIGCGGANWFAQAAEDARKIIWYLHNYEIPEDAY